MNKVDSSAASVANVTSQQTAVEPPKKEAKLKSGSTIIQVVLPILGVIASAALLVVGALSFVVTFPLSQGVAIVAVILGPLGLAALGIWKFSGKSGSVSTDTSKPVKGADTTTKDDKTKKSAEKTSTDVQKSDTAQKAPEPDQTESAKDAEAQQTEEDQKEEKAAVLADVQAKAREAEKAKSKEESEKELKAIRTGLKEAARTKNKDALADLILKGTGFITTHSDFAESEGAQSLKGNMTKVKAFVNITKYQDEFEEAIKPKNSRNLATIETALQKWIDSITEASQGSDPDLIPSDALSEVTPMLPVLQSMHSLITAINATLNTPEGQRGTASYRTQVQGHLSTIQKQQKGDNAGPEDFYKALSEVLEASLPKVKEPEKNAKEGASAKSAATPKDKKDDKAPKAAAEAAVGAGAATPAPAKDGSLPTPTAHLDSQDPKTVVDPSRRPPAPPAAPPKGSPNKRGKNRRSSKGKQSIS